MSINSQLPGHPPVILFSKHLTISCMSSTVFGAIWAKLQHSKACLSRGYNIWKAHERGSGEFFIPVIHQVFIPYLWRARHHSKQCGISSKGNEAPALMKPIFWGAACPPDHKQTNRNIISGTDQYYGEKIEGNREWQAALFWIFREDFIKESADTCMVLKGRFEWTEGASHVLCGERVPFQAEPPASAEAEARVAAPQGTVGREDGTRLWQGFQIFF